MKRHFFGALLWFMTWAVVMFYSITLVAFLLTAANTLANIFGIAVVFLQVWFTTEVGNNLTYHIGRLIDNG